LLAAIALFAALGLGSLARTHPGRTADPSPPAPEAYGTLPLSFIPNRGQLETGKVRYYAHGSGFAFQFTDDNAAIALTKGERGYAIQLRPLGASEDARLVAGERTAGRVNYLAAQERHPNLPTYGSLTYRNLWPGIDMAIKGSGGRLKYEFHLAPGADPADIHLAYAGASGVSLTESGVLSVATPLGALNDARPRTYQSAGGRRIPVKSSFAIDGKRSYGFSLGAYDRARPVVIDPGLAYSTFLGGSGNERSQSITVDRQGHARPHQLSDHARRLSDGRSQRSELLRHEALSGRVGADLFHGDRGGHERGRRGGGRGRKRLCDRRHPAHRLPDDARRP
jgi:hypothetical protein